MPDEAQKQPVPSLVTSPTSVGIESPKAVEGVAEAPKIEFHTPPEMASYAEASPVVKPYIQVTSDHKPLTKTETGAGIFDSYYFSSIDSLSDVTLPQAKQSLKQTGSNFSLFDSIGALFAEKPRRFLDAAKGFWAMFTRQKEREALSHA